MKNLQRLKQFLTDPIALMHDLSKNSPKYCRMKLGPKNFLFVFDYSLALEILRNKNNCFGTNKNILEKIMPVTGANGLVQLEGIESKTCRQESRAIFSKEKVEDMRATISNISNNFITSLSEGPQDISSCMLELVLLNAFKIFLGTNLSEKHFILAQNFLELNQLCGRRMKQIFSSPLWWPSANNRRIKLLSIAMQNFLLGKLNIKNQEQTNFLKTFQNSPHLLDQCKTFLFAGHETTASSLAFTFLLISKYPKWQNAIADGDSKVAKAIYNESLRLFPPAYMVVKQANQNYILGEIKGKKGDQVIIAISAIHKDPKFYPKPEQFQPERFFEPQKALPFLPFSKGPKSCIGEHMAYLEADIILQSFCRTFKISPMLFDIKYEQLITLHPAPNQFIKIKKR